MNSPSITIQSLSLLGAFLILLAYIGHQAKWINANKVFYNLLNTAGAAILGYIALKPFQAGFFIMEVIWTLISLFALWKIVRKGKG